VAVLAMAFAGFAEAQTLPVGDPAETYLRIMQLVGRAELGSFTVRPLSRESTRSAVGPAPHPWSDWLRLDPTGSNGDVAWTVGDTRLRSWLNTAYPRGQNDGAVWQGKGMTTALETTASLEWGGLSVTLNPMLLHNQNSAFELAPVTVGGLPEYAYPWRRMDYPQRFGPEAFWTFDLGQSQVAFDWRGGRVSFGNENLQWGPGIRNAIVMGANAPGFLHASLSTNRPVDIGIGTLEGQWIWGGLGQSDWFDPALAATDRYMTGLVLTYSPSFLPGLSVGGTRVFQELVPDGGLDAAEYLLVLQGLVKSSQASVGNPRGEDERDQLLSLFARWVFPNSGFETYVEWSRNDHAASLEDFILEPEHSQGYTLGLQKATAFSGERALVLRAELTHLEAPPTFQLRPRGTYYEHSIVTQGYTNKGQLLGAGVGPGGNGQMVGFDWYDVWGKATVFAQRQVIDNDAFWVWAEQTGASFDKHDVALDFGATATWFVGDFDVGGGLMFTREWNRYFFGPKINNVNLNLTARWRPRP
jgi:capsule assembly protein Wzi